ncbi:MAG: ABC transporter substrate-binding protein, partial [Nitrospirota bacterium]|nr:ABC transporter substrate-binding protein [Nitrospirota bacterium]
GISGKKLELVHMDNRNDSETTKDAMGELIRQKVVAVVANPTGWSTFGPIGLANEYHTIIISAGTRRKTGHSGGYVFRNTAPDEQAVAEVIKYAATKLGHKGYALITAMDDDYSITLSGIFKKEILENGGTVAVENYAMTGVAESEGQYAELAREIKAKGGVQAIVYTGGVGAGKLLKEVRKQGVKAPLIGSEELYAGSFLAEAGDAAIDSILFTGYMPTPEAAGFIKAYKAKAGAEPDAMAALAYDAVMLVAKAIETAGSTSPDKVQEALAHTKDYRGITGVTSYDGMGEPVKKPVLVKVTKQGSALAFAPVQ